MDIAGSEGAEPYEAACDGSRSQQWELLVDRADQEVHLRNYATGMCLTHTTVQQDASPVRQERAACRSTAVTALWTYFVDQANEVAFAEPNDTLFFLGLNDWHAAGEGAPHSPGIGTTTNYYNTTSLRFRYTGHAFGG